MPTQPTGVSDCRYRVAILNDCRVHTVCVGWLVAPRSEMCHHPEITVRPIETGHIFVPDRPGDEQEWCIHGNYAIRDGETVLTYMYEGEVRQTCSFKKFCTDRICCLIDCTLVIELAMKGQEPAVVTVVRMVETEAMNRGAF